MASYTTAPHHELSESDIFSRGTRTFGWFSPRIAHSASTSFHSRITFTACASAGAPSSVRRRRARRPEDNPEAAFTEDGVDSVLRTLLKRAERVVAFS